MKKRVRPVPGVRVATAFGVILLAIVISTCDVFAPPFVFDNPYDPQQEIRYLESFGHPLYENGGGLARPDRIAVAHGQYIAAVRPDRARIEQYFFGEGRYQITEFLHDDGHGDHAHDVCIGSDGAIYVAQWRGIHRVNPVTGSVQRFWFERDQHEFLRLAPDPNGGIWALMVERTSSGERLRLKRFSTDGDVWFDRAYDEMMNQNFWEWDIAVSRDLIAISRRYDVLYINRWSGVISHRLIRDEFGQYVMVPDGSEYSGLHVDGIAYNEPFDRFVAVGAWQTPDFHRVAYLDGTNGEFIGAVGNDFELIGQEWRGVAVSSGVEYVSDRFTGKVVRTDTWATVHENAHDDPLGFLGVTALAFDPANRDLLYVADREAGAITVIDTLPGGFDGFFGNRGFEHGQIARPDSIFIDATGVYVSSYGMIARYSRAGNIDSEPVSVGYHVQNLLVHDGYIVGTFGYHDGAGYFVYDIVADEIVARSDYYAPDGAFKLGLLDDQIIAVRHSRQAGNVAIGTFDPATREFTGTGSFPESVLRRHHYHHVGVTDIAVTPYGFIWITAQDRIAVRVDTEGNVYRTLTFDRRDELLSVTGGPDGRTYFGFEHGVEVYGGR